MRQAGPRLRDAPAFADFVVRHHLGAWRAPALADERVRRLLPASLLRSASEEEPARRADERQGPRDLRGRRRAVPGRCRGPLPRGRLEGIGYAREEGRVGEGAVRRGLRRGDATVDVHWNLLRRARRRLPEEGLWADRVRFDLAGQPLGTLSDDNTLLFLLLAICGDLRRGACSVRLFTSRSFALPSDG